LTIAALADRFVERSIDTLRRPRTREAVHDGSASTSDRRSAGLGAGS
jgi:hypothetical protein